MRYFGRTLVATSAALMVGCGLAPGAGTTRTDLTVDPATSTLSGAAQVQSIAGDVPSGTASSAAGLGRQGPAGGRTDPKTLGFALPFLRELDLSRQQRQQIQTILQSAHGTQVRTKATFATHWNELKGIFLADQVDQAKLTSFIQEGMSSQGKHLAQMAGTVGAIRKVLTEDQRSKLLDLLAKRAQGDDRHGHGWAAGFKSAWPGRPLNKLIADLKLSAEQEAKLKELRCELVAIHKRPGARTDAIREFIQSGDEAAFAAALQAQAANRFPVTDLVRFAASLSLDQRRKLVEDLDSFSKPT